jgi:hypothetical protein
MSTGQRTPPWYMEDEEAAKGKSEVLAVVNVLIVFDVGIVNDLRLMSWGS